MNLLEARRAGATAAEDAALADGKPWAFRRVYLVGGADWEAVIGRPTVDERTSQPVIAIRRVSVGRLG